MISFGRIINFIVDNQFNNEYKLSLFLISLEIAVIIALLITKKWKRRDVLDLAMIILLTIFFSSLILHNKVFFSYNETDTKYLYSMQLTKNSGTWHIYGTTQIGYYSLLLPLYNAFNITNIFQAFTLSEAIMVTEVFLFLLAIYLIMRYLKGSLRKRKKKDGWRGYLDFIILTIMIFSFQAIDFSIFHLKIVYFAVFISTLFSYYFYLEMKKSKDENFWLYNILFFTNAYLSCHTRPEGLLLNLPIFLIYFYDVVTKKTKRKLRTTEEITIYLLFILLFILCVNTVIVLYSALSRPGNITLSHQLIHEIKDEIKQLGFGNQVAAETSFVLIFILLNFLFKETVIFGIIYLPELIITSLTKTWDPYLFTMYFSISTILFFIYWIRKSKKNYPEIAMVVLMILFFNLTQTYTTFQGSTNGQGTLNFYHELKNKNITIYELWPRVFSDYLFMNTSVKSLRYNKFSPQKNALYLSRENCKAIRYQNKTITLEKYLQYPGNGWLCKIKEIKS